MMIRCRTTEKAERERDIDRAMCRHKEAEIKHQVLVCDQGVVLQIIKSKNIYTHIEIVTKCAAHILKFELEKISDFRYIRFLSLLCVMPMNAISTSCGMLFSKSIISLLTHTYRTKFVRWNRVSIYLTRSHRHQMVILRSVKLGVRP